MKERIEKMADKELEAFLFENKRVIWKSDLLLMISEELMDRKIFKIKNK